MIARDSVDQVIASTDIVEVVGDFVTLKKRGANYLGLCPFHNEKTPSFNVNPVRGIYKCFGCGKGGSAVDFVMEHEKYSFPEAIRFLAGKYNIELEESGLKEDEGLKDERENLFALNEYARNFFVDTLISTNEGKSIGLSYFKERGFRDDTIEKFQLGYSPDAWGSLTQKAVKQGFREEYLETSGLSVKNQEKGSLYDRFRGRVMFPIHNLTGRVIGFGGRVLKTEKKAAKYVNSPESPVYHKSDTLYGIFFAKNKIRELDNCFLVEGYTDVISLNQAGLENVVASSGTSLTSGQIRLISRYTKNITILYDGDPAGIKASMRGIDMILEEGLNVKVVLFPDGHDPDSFVRANGGANCSEYISGNQKDFILFKTSLLQSEAGTDPIKKAEVIGQIVESISKIPDSIKASVFVTETSRLLKIDERALLSELNKHRLKKIRQNEKNASPAEKPASEEFPISSATETLTENDDAQEKEILRLMLTYGNESFDDDNSVNSFLLANLEDVSFDNPAFATYYDELKNQVGTSGDINPQLLVHHSDKNIRECTVELLASKYSLSENWLKMHDITVPTEAEVLGNAVLSAIFHLKMRKVIRLITQNQLKMQEAESEGEQEYLLNEHIRLTNIKRILSQELGTVIIK